VLLRLCRLDYLNSMDKSRFTKACKKVTFHGDFTCYWTPGLGHSQKIIKIVMIYVHTNGFALSLKTAVHFSVYYVCYFGVPYLNLTFVD
jgi:hypothetical protein